MNIDLIQCLILDVDGVLTDGAVYLDETGRSLLRFDIKDGMGIRAWQSCGLDLAILSARACRAVACRAAQLDITHLSLGQSDKLTGYENLCGQLALTDEQVAYIGDDLNDLPVLCRVGLPIAPADAAPEVRQVARLVTDAPGGHGCVRQAIQYILTAKGLWEQVLERFGL